MSSWGWNPNRSEGVWRFGVRGLRPFVALAPWITLVLLILMFHCIGQTFTLSKGVLFGLPDGTLNDDVPTDHVALLMVTEHETIIFFNDMRYRLDDKAEEGSLKRSFANSIADQAKNRSLLVLADRRVSGGDLMKFANIARQGGFERLLFAEKKSEAFK